MTSVQNSNNSRRGSNTSSSNSKKSSIKTTNNDQQQQNSRKTPATKPVSESGENTCVVCFKIVEVFSVGICDHPVCYECSTRMRVLCKQMECPICRQEMTKVVFVKEVKPFSQLNSGTYPMDKASRICFENSTIQDLFKKLLVHACRICPEEPAFVNVQQLKDHLRKEHEQFFCDLCLENLKIFSWERRSYSRPELALHRRKGDPDNTSHRGHPLCNFCDQRYVDNDELFRHLRRDHYFCHFCDADGLNQYYCAYEDLRVHFLDSHYLCEEGECRDEKFTRVFRTDIDLRAHRAQVHSHSLGKAAAKQARTLELEFTLAPRPTTGGDGRGRGQRRGGPRPLRERDEPQQMQQQQQQQQQQQENGIDDRDRTPRFVGAAAANFRDHEQFPSLGATDSASALGTTSAASGGSSSDSLAQKLAKGNRFTVRSGSKSTDEFPSLVVETSNSSAAASDANKGQQKKGRHGGEMEAPERTQGKRSVYLRLSSQEDPQSGGSSSNVSIQLMQNYPPPSQSGAGPPSLARVMRVSSTQNIRVQPSPSLRLQDTDFPSLAPVPSQQSQAANWVKKESAKVANNNNNSSKTVQQMQQPTKNQVVKNQRSPLAAEDFPSLAPSKSTGSASAQPAASWVSVKGKNSGGVISSSSATATVNGNKASSVTIPVASNGDSALTKAKKKKNAARLAQGDINGADIQESVAERKVSAMQIGALKSLSSQMGGMSLDLIGVANAVETRETVGSKISVIKQPLQEPTKASQEAVKPKNRPVLALSRDDFPALGPTPIQPSGAAVPSLFERPSKRSTPAAPPGFSPGDLTPTKVTFTSSSGKSFPLSVDQGSSTPNAPATSGSSIVYLQPADFASRNKALITTITDLLGEQQDRFSQFRSLSALFRSGSVQPESYYHDCLEIMGEDCFLALFPELLVLLPDIEKQQQLLKVHRSQMRLMMTGSAASVEPYVVCATCSQVLSPTDLKHHLASHSLETHFPVLANSTGVDSNSAWSKR